MSQNQTVRVEKQATPNQLAILKALMDNGSLSLTDLQAKLLAIGQQFSLPYVSTETSKLIDEGMLTYNLEGNKKILSIVEGVQPGENSIFMEVSATQLTPEDRLAQTLELFNVKGDAKRKVLTLMATNPTWNNPANFFNLLLTLKVDPSSARLISEHYFGSQQWAQAQQYAQAPNISMGWGQPQGQMQMLQPYGQQGATVAIAPNGQPFVVNPPTQPQYPSVPVQQQQVTMRRVQRPMKAADGTFVKDAGGNFIYETIEEPVSASGNSNSDALTLIMTQQAERDRQERERRDTQEKAEKDRRELQEKYDKELRGEREKREKEEREAERAAEKERLDRQERMEKERRESEERIRKIEADARIEAEKAKAETEKLRQEALDKRLVDMQKENSENIQGLFATVQKNSETLSKTFNDTLKTMQMENQHAREIDTVKAQLTAQSSAGERPIVGIGKELNRTMRELPTNIAAAIRQVAPVLPQGIAGQIPTMSPEQQAEAARKLAEQSKNMV